MSSGSNGSNSLIPISTGGGLQQQGSIDWVRLIGSSVSFSVEFLVRLSNGGVETLTVCAAEAVLSRLRLGPHGELRLQEAVAQLKAFSSFNKALWFGFGVKHVIRQLAESSEGLNCIAVCAALVEAYSPLDSAKILREMLLINNAPDRLTPSLRQWICLVEMCAGALASTDFGVTVHNITRLCLTDGTSSLRIRSEPAAIAQALNSIIMVSNGSLDRVQLLGGADCGWIAAFSSWLLDVLVEVRDVSGQTLYRSGPEDTRRVEDAKVLVIYGDPSITELQIMKRCFVIPGGQLLVRDNLQQGIRQEALDGDLFSYGRVSWSSLLKDTFGKPMRDLIDGGLATLCGTALGCAARIFTSIITDDRDLPDYAYAKYRQGWAYINFASHGPGFINTIRQFLPELSESERLMDAIEFSSVSTYIEAVGKYEQAIHVIASACSCNVCTFSSEALSNPDLPPNQPFCQTILVEVISELVQIISSLSVSTTIFPARSGVEDLYWHRWEPDRRYQGWSYVYKGLLEHRSPNDVLISAKHLFSGRYGKNDPIDPSAKASGGLCFVTDTLIHISANQEQCNHLHIIPGRIEWKGNIFDETIDYPYEENFPGGPQYLAISGTTISSTSCIDLEDTSSPDITCQLEIEENGGNHARSINVAYRIATSNGRFRIGPSAITRQIRSAITAKDCKGRSCGPVSPFDLFCIRGEGLVANDGVTHVQGIPLVRVHTDSVPAQWVVLSQDSLYTSLPLDFRLQPTWATVVLQDRQCLHCLLMSTIQGPRSKHNRSDARTVCIVTRL
ncbi:hypothetical protein MMC30_008778 [Trapelia coarctata]|nr:hypothetical protein [Trapelia coarctata]